MKKLLSGLALLIGSLVFALPVHAAPFYCGPGAYNASYKAIFNYPTGSYWVSQISAYPDYYAANNAFYVANYHC